MAKEWNDIVDACSDVVRFGYYGPNTRLIEGCGLEITRLRSELTRALSLLAEWAPDTFEQNYMTPEQRAEANKDDREWYAQLADDRIKTVLEK